MSKPLQVIPERHSEQGSCELINKYSFGLSYASIYESLSQNQYINGSGFNENLSFGYKYAGYLFYNNKSYTDKVYNIAIDDMIKDKDR